MQLTALWYDLQLQNVSGPGDPAMYSCWQSHLDYSWSTLSPTGTVKTMPYYAYETWETNRNPAKTTLCDGVPRYLGPTVKTVTITKLDWSAEQWIRDKPLPSPTCSLSEEQCSSLYSAFTTTRWNLWNSYNSISSSKRGKDPGFRYNLFEPNTLKPPCETITTCGPNCKLGAYSPTIFYWPTATLAPSDLGCSESGSTPLASSLAGPAAPALTPPPPTPTPVLTPQSAVILGQTVTSPSALIILGSLMAVTTTSGLYYKITTCGPNLKNVFLTVAQSDLSSPTVTGVTKLWDSGTQSSARFDFAHLATPPYSKVITPSMCLDARFPRDKTTRDLCNTRITNYKPALIIPTAARNLYKLWSDCDVGILSGWDGLGPYISITAETMDLPSVTYYGRTMSGKTLGPLLSTVVPAAEATHVFMNTPKPVSIMKSP